MRVALAVLMSAHSAFHVMGFAKAFGLASLAQLKMPISHPMGVLWLTAAVLILAAVVLLFAAPRWFWLVALAGLAASQIVIIASWGDARFGTIGCRSPPSRSTSTTHRAATSGWRRPAGACPSTASTPTARRTRACGSGSCRWFPSSTSAARR